MARTEPAIAKIERPAEREYLLVPAGELLKPMAPPEMLVDGLIERGAHIGYVAPPESAKSLFALNIAACVAANRSFHGRQVRPGLVVYLCGEGYPGVGRRLQALELRYQFGLASAPLVLSKTSASLLDPIEVMRVLAAIQQAESLHGVKLSLLIVDTLARFIAPGKESDAPDMSAYFQAVDALRGDAAAITLHHPGHGDATRARGSSSWRAALDAEFIFARSGDVVTITCSKVKDARKPDPFSLRLEQAPTFSAHENGAPVQSIVLVPTHVTALPKLSGKNQVALRAVLAQYRRETNRSLIAGDDFRTRARNAGIDRRRFSEAVPSLEHAGYITPSGGGWSLRDDV